MMNDKIPAKPAHFPIAMNVPEVAGLELISGVLCYKGIAVSVMKAWPINLAARLCGMATKAFRDDVARGLIKLSRHDLVSEKELDRFLAMKDV